jgi:predicted Rossmann-fold nucleotide-binding protein
MKNKETLEEAAERYTESTPDNDPVRIFSFIEGAKWQQENMIEELEMHVLINEHDWNRNPQAQFRDFVEQFKKK